PALVLIVHRTRGPIASTAKSTPPRTERISASTFTSTLFCLVALLLSSTPTPASLAAAEEEEQRRRPRTRPPISYEESGEEGGVERSYPLPSSLATVECGAERRRGFEEGERERERDVERRR
ncbi:unnamed protein product, partial [Ectocarpus sp. 13 AM-2016]